MLVGILTFHQVANYGAVLQCFALKKTIESMGYECEVIPHICTKLVENEKIFSWEGNLFVNILKCCSQVSGTRKKRKAFDEFLKDYCEIIEDSVKLSKYDAVVVGSDQVWNLRLTKNDFTYLLEGLEGVRKISYAASFGEGSTDYDELPRMLKCVREFNAVSVREKKAQDFLKKNDILSEVVCDPVFLYGRENWLEIVKNKEITDKNYILVYCIEKSPNVFDYARELSKKTGKKIVYLNQNYLALEKDFTYRRGISPVGFLQYIYNADYVITNSFHGTALSILFHKKFISDRIWHGSDNNRIVELLTLLGLKDRLLQVKKHPDEEINYTDVDDKIAKYVQMSKEFLEKSIIKD